eukprot:COSAG02_NODE_76447_length_134_cov_637.028571_1_plen_24_part_10
MPKHVQCARFGGGKPVAFHSKRRV